MLNFGDLRRLGRIYIRQRTPKRRNDADTWVLLFPKYKIAYIPIPKAANSSIRAEMLRLLGIDPETIARIQEFDGFEKQRYSRCAHLLTNEWLVFTAVRDPYTRIVSAYFDKLKLRKKGPFIPFQKMGLDKTDGFDRFLSLIHLWPKDALNDHIMPQSRLLNGAMTLPFLRVIKIEELEAEWPRLVADVEARSGIRLQPLGHRNAGHQNSPGTSIYTPDTIKAVTRIYRQDFQMFGYDRRI